MQESKKNSDCLMLCHIEGEVREDIQRIGKATQGAHKGDKKMSMIPGFVSRNKRYCSFNLFCLI